jgi:cytochrome P450
MTAFDDLLRLPDVSWLGSLGPTTAERLTFQRTLANTTAPLVRGRVMHLPVALPCSPEACHEVLVSKAKSFEKSPGFRVLLNDLAGRGLFTSEGELWRSQRKLMSPLFQPAPIQHYAETMRQVALRAADAMTPGASVDVAHETMRIAMSIVGKALFDADTFDEADALGDALTKCLAWVNRSLASPGIVAHVLALDATEAIATRTQGRARELALRANRAFCSPFLLPGARAPELREAVAVLDDRIQQMIDERRRQGLHRNDLLTRLLTVRDEEHGGTMSDKQVRDEAVTIFVAGHETTATALAWSFYLLARHPEIAARVQAEADAFGDAPIDRWQPERLLLATGVFKEAMRLYPPIMMLARRTLEPVEIAGTPLPAKTLTFVSAYAQHYRPSNFPEPKRFDPDRWLPEREAERHKSSYLPFSAGPRVCIGLHFAMIEGPVVLATLLRKRRFAIDPQRTIGEDDFATLRPRGGIPAVVHAR